MASIGLALFGHPAHVHVPIARRAEQLGFDGIWIGEHVLAFESHQSVDPHRPDSPPVLGPSTDLYDIWTLAGAVLAATEHLYVSTGIYIAPLRHPLSSALSAITAAKIGGSGRFRLGVGAGWMSEEFVALGQEFDTRFRRLPEILGILRATSSGGFTSFEGRYYQHESLRLTEEPVTVPVIMGGVTPNALRRAAELGDGWYNPGLVDLETCCRIRDEIEQYRRQAGTAGTPFTYYIRAVASGEPVDRERYTVAGFENLVVPWESLWSPEERKDLALSDKLVRLEDAARQLGIEPR